MRYLEKSEKPTVLIDNKKAWTDEYLLFLENNPTGEFKKYKYNHKDLKTALAKETHGKCAYCESYLLATDYGDIEHILPKNRNARPDLCYDWDNLTLACAKCNRSGKKDYYDIDLPLLNPYIDDIETHLISIGPYIRGKSERGTITEEVIILNRPGLISSRNDIINSIENLYKSWFEENNTIRKSLKETELHKEYEINKKYSFTIWSYLKARGFPVNAI